MMFGSLNSSGLKDFAGRLGSPERPVPYQESVRAFSRPILEADDKHSNEDAKSIVLERVIEETTVRPEPVIIGKTYYEETFSVIL